MTAYLDVALYLAFPIAMALGAFCDLTTMTIPNRLSAALALLFPFAAVALGMPIAVFGMHLVAGFVVLTVGILFFSRGWIGGGDAKLAAAVALWFGFDQMLPFIAYVGVLGGFLTIGLLIYRSWMLPAFAVRHEWMTRLHDKSVGVPYGIAIAAGAMMIYAETPFASLAAGLL